MADVLDTVTGDTGPEVTQSDVYDRFLDLLERYGEEVSDPTKEQVAELCAYFEQREPENLNRETLALMWVMCSIIQWMYDSLPTQGETRDPEWLRQQLEIFGTVDKYTE